MEQTVLSHTPVSTWGGESADSLSILVHCGLQEISGNQRPGDEGHSPKLYGRARWRKRKGIARVRLPNGATRLAEVHWYEAHGIGRREFKIKRYAD